MYQALYSKWRPQTFADVSGQEVITDSLKNQVASGRTSHAYMFTGSRGTGKTTCARILALAVNCLNPVQGNPCLECEVCTQVSSLTDIVEIDAASNNGVDDVRALRDIAVYAPSLLKFRVYIIDEVHMLSGAAFNALLKILEEPPAHVKFILATTELHKVPATVLSRCQRYDFRRIPADAISRRLMFIAEKEGMRLEQTAADVLAVIADGGMRDAVSLLDQCSARSDHITDDTVYSVAGAVSREYLFDIIRAAADRDCMKIVSIIGSLYEQSKDMGRLCAELSGQMRNIMLIKSGAAVDCMPREKDILQDLSSRFSMNEVFALLDLLQASAGKRDRTDVEMIFIRFLNRSSVSETNVQNLAVQAVPGGFATQSNVQNSAVQEVPNGFAPQHNVQNSAVQAVPKQITPPEIPVNNSATVPEAKQPDASADKKPIPFAAWGNVLKAFHEISPAISGTLDGSAAFCTGDSIIIATRNGLFKELFKRE
ncbi:MAG: DNA polymerase III subunit gamma/tau, partial [Oscillospiraceae bacterium]|nr:DNA polymerase III subunit gamma/tau [Oscillospiraceae bacterium]